MLASLLWGANPVVIKLGLLDAPPLRLAGLRFLVGVLLTLQIGFMNVGTSLTTAAHVAIVLNLYAVHTVVLAHFMIPGDRLTPRRLVGVLVAYAGIVVLFGRGFTLAGDWLVGDALTFVSALLLAERTVYLARAVQRLDPVKLLVSQAAIGASLFLVFSALAEPAPTRWTARLGLAVAYQGILITGFNFVVNLWLLKHYRPSALAAIFLTQPIFGVIAAALFAGDPLTFELVIASVAVAAGMGLTSR